jgi:hypothetical protein
MFIPNLFGMPMAKIISTVDVDVEIYTNNDRLIARYNASGINKSYSALYYGYKYSSLGRISGIKAFRMAMNDVKLKIESDKERLLRELNMN